MPSQMLNWKMISVWRIHGVIQTAVWCAVSFGIAAAVCFSATGIGNIPYFIAGALTVSLLILLVFILPPLKWRRFRYEVYADEIDIFKGIIVRQRIVVPLVRVQYTDTSQGPIMRAIGLAEMNVSTAAGNQSIPGLLPDEADALRDYVATLAKQVREDV
jgi:membrane protein YdbS with pleckstrin-like domain